MKRAKIILIPLFYVMLIYLGTMMSGKEIMAQTGTGNGIASYNVAVTGVTKVIAFNKGNMAIMMHPEDGTVRCNPGNVGGDVPTPPTTSSGVELVSGGYYNSGTVTPASVEWDCTPEFGGTVHMSGIIVSQ